MKKTVGLVALLISSAAVMVQPALASDRDDYARNNAPVRQEVRTDYRSNDYRDNNYRDNDRRDRRDYRRVDVRSHRDDDRR